jgi:hypothetical protein
MIELQLESENAISKIATSTQGQELKSVFEKYSFGELCCFIGKQTTLYSEKHDRDTLISKNKNFLLESDEMVNNYHKKKKALNLQSIFISNKLYLIDRKEKSSSIISTNITSVSPNS